MAQASATLCVALLKLFFTISPCLLSRSALFLESAILLIYRFFNFRHNVSVHNMSWFKPNKKIPIPSQLHPYYPIGVDIANYLANERDFVALLGIFAAGCIVICTSTWIFTGMFCSQLKQLNRAIILWFVMTGSIHLFFEGYFALNHQRMAPAQDIFGQLWKEYSYSDSR